MYLSKTLFREKCLNKIKKSNIHNRYHHDMQVNKKLLKILKKYSKKSILFYYPLGFEADIKKSLQYARKKNSVCLPFMEGSSFKMVPFRLPLEKKKFGIYEAANSNRKIKQIDIAIVPVVGVDGNLQRIGFGKGMYDRFFPTLHKRPFTIFIQPISCYTKELLCDEYDITCNLFISSNTMLHNKGIK